jgi:hypothetical protein
MEHFHISASGVGSVHFYTPHKLINDLLIAGGMPSVRFPGAVNSKFTTEMAFINPQDMPSIPTYRVMDSDGVLVDKSRKKLEVSDEEILTWYKNMLTGVFTFCFYIQYYWRHELIWDP